METWSNAEKTKFRDAVSPLIKDIIWDRSTSAEGKWENIRNQEKVFLFTGTKS